MDYFISKHIKKHPLSAWVAFFLWLILIFSASYTSFSLLQHQAIQRFDYDSREVANAISERMYDYQLALRSGKALFDASDQVTRNDWQNFSDTIQLQKYFPGIQALGYSEMVAAEFLATHIQTIRSQGFPEYRVKPEGHRKQYSAIIYIEPFDWRNQRALGFDMFSEPVRQQAMALARDTNEAAATGKVILVQETHQTVQYGFLIYVPVYHQNKTLSFVDERRRALKGFVYAAFRIEDLMQGILGIGQDELDFEIYDIGDSGTELLYKNSKNAELIFPIKADFRGVSHTYDLNIAGRSWRLFVYSHDVGMRLSERYLPIFITIVLTLLGVLLFYFISFLSRDRSYAQREAVKANLEKNYLTQQVELAVDTANLGLMKWDLHTDTIYFDKRMFAINGVSPDSFHGSYKEWLQVIHPDDREWIMTTLEQASQFEEKFDASFRIIVNNKVRNIRARFSVERDLTDNPITIVGFMADVTKQHELDAKLHEKNWRLAHLLADTKLGIWELNMQTGELVCNERWAEMLGYKLTELMPMTVDSVKKILPSRGYCSR